VDFVRVVWRVGGWAWRSEEEGLDCVARCVWVKGLNAYRELSTQYSVSNLSFAWLDTYSVICFRHSYSSLPSTPTTPTFSAPRQCPAVGPSQGGGRGSDPATRNSL